MSFNLLDTAKSLFTNELISKASAYLGEKENGISKAISGIVPAVLGLFADKTATAHGANELAAKITEQKNDGSHLSLGSFFNNDGGNLLNKGAGLANDLFGSKLPAVTENISNYAGIKQSSTASLISMAIPALLGFIGKQGAGNGNLQSIFSGQKNNILSAIPSGLDFSNLLPGFSAKVSDIHSGTHTPKYKAAEKEKSGMGWLLPVLLLALLAMAAWYFLGKGCNSDDTRTTHSDSVVVDNTNTNVNVNTPVVAMGKVDSLSGDWMYNEGDTITIDLPNNAGKLTVGKYSTEAKLVAFLNDKNAMVDTVKGNWFEFTNVHFKTGSADITEGSKTQLMNLATICKAFSTAQFKLGGYTDSTGSVATNIAVSQKRADAVMAFLKKSGVPANSFTGAKGYGPEWPIADNKTAEGRAQNRRVAVNVKAK